MRQVKIGKAIVSRLCIGGNPFSGFSHRGVEENRRMVGYYTPDRIKQTLKEAEQAGINTFFGRTDDHICGIIRDYWARGGAIQWFAQVCQDRDDPDSWRKWLGTAAELGATGAYLHGGVVDHWHAGGRFDLFRQALDMMRAAGLVAGFAGHSPAAHRWIRDNLAVDFQMCSHYNPTERAKSPHHVSTGERWDDGDRALMLGEIARIRTPVVHYKVFAAGNKPIVPAFEFLGGAVRPQDVVLAGFFTGDNPDMIRDDVAFFEKHVERSGGQARE